MPGPGIITVSQGAPNADPTQAWPVELWNALGNIALALATNGAMKVVESGGRNLSGVYFAAISPQQGTSGVGQVIATIENPSTSNRNLFLRRVIASSVLPTIDTLRVAIAAVRTNANVPTGGASIAVTQRRTADTLTAGIVRQGAQATAGVGYLWSSLTGIVFTAAGEYVPKEIPLIDAKRELDEVVVLPGEALEVFVPGAGSINHLWTVKFFWSEGTENT